MNIKYFVNNIIKETEKCMDKKMYLAALKMALELPRVLATYMMKGEEATLTDYSAWCNAWVGGLVGMI